MLNSPKHRQLIAELPEDRLITEADGPFVLTQGKPIRPREVSDSVSQLAALRAIPMEGMKRAILDNLRALLVSNSS